MIHQYKLNGYNIVLDTCSGSVHAVDEIAYDMISLYGTKSEEEIISLMAQLLGDREADLAIPDDDDFHVLPSFLMVCTAFAHTFYYNLPNCPDIIDKNRKETKKKRQRTAM